MSERTDRPAPILDVKGLVVIPTPDKGAGPPILNGVTLSIGAGETLCLVGESGSGKTMTALAVMGLLPPRELAVAEGSIRLAGEELTTADPSRLRALRAARMAMVFQEPMTALNPLMTVGRQIDGVLRAHTGLERGERRARIRAMLGSVELNDAERVSAAYPYELSGGQRQRVMIAMALALEPMLLIADEPTSALDVMTQRRILRLLADLRDRRGVSMLFITHDMGVVREVADRVAVMAEGQIAETGSLAAIMARPRRAGTRALIAAVPSLAPQRTAPRRRGASILSVRGLAKTFGDRRWFGRARPFEAVAGADLSLAPGETFGIVGESGSGKSTLARCILRLIEPTAGSIVLDGADLTHLPESALKPYRKALQPVFQDPYRSLNPRLTAAQSIIEGPSNFAAPRAEALPEARALIEQVGLPAEAAGSLPHRFSGGQRQRIALARALALRPRVLVADEPVSALDMPTQARILELLAAIQARTGIAILFITHDLRVAARICDRIAVMRAGRIVESGPAARVLTAPRNAYTRQLCEAVPGRDWDFAAFRRAARPAERRARPGKA